MSGPGGWVVTGQVYRRRPWRVAAIQWTGDNWTEVDGFLVDHLGEDCRPREIDPDDEYRMIQFESPSGADCEVDIGNWILVHLDGDHDRREVEDNVSGDTLRIEYEPVEQDPAS